MYECGGRVRTYLAQGGESERSTGGVAESHQSHGLQGRHLSYIQNIHKLLCGIVSIAPISTNIHTYMHTYMDVVALFGGSESSLDHGVAQRECPIERPQIKIKNNVCMLNVSYSVCMHVSIYLYLSTTAGVCGSFWRCSTQRTR